LQGFVCGFGATFLLAYSVVDTTIPDLGELNAIYGAAVFTGIVAGILFVCYQRVAIMLGTAYLGSFLVWAGVFQGFVGGTEGDLEIGIVQPVLTYVLFIIGFAVQYKFTSKGVEIDPRTGAVTIIQVHTSPNGAVTAVTQQGQYGEGAIKSPLMDSQWASSDSGPPLRAMEPHQSCQPPPADKRTVPPPPLPQQRPQQRPPPLPQQLPQQSQTTIAVQSGTGPPYQYRYEYLQTNQVVPQRRVHWPALDNVDDVLRTAKLAKHQPGACIIYIILLCHDSE
jgi:hypothetical protein